MEPLVAFPSVDTTAMRWIRPAAERTAFARRAGDALLARLEWPGSVGSLARASLQGSEWTLKRGGFLQPHITLRDAAGADRARLSAHLTHHTLTLAGGTTYRFRRAGMLVPAWQFSDPSGRPVVHIEPVPERARLSGGLVQVDASFAKDPELPVLIVSGWYFIVLAWFEDEALQASERLLAAASE